MKHLCFLSTLLLCAIAAYAQTSSPVTITPERSSKGDIVFWADNRSPIPYTVTLTFTKLGNTVSASEGVPQEMVATTGKRRLFSLRPSSEQQPVTYSYRVRMRRGDAKVRADTTFVYLFPLAEGKKVKVIPGYSYSLEKVLERLKEGDTSRPQKSPMTGVGFKTTEGDTIVAARRGVVSEVVEQKPTGDQTSDRSKNYVEVYHPDGTFARYMLLKYDGIFVKEGDEVFPGQPLGIIGSGTQAFGSHLRFTVTLPGENSHRFLPCFYLSSEQAGQPDLKTGYVVAHPASIIMQEMSKKEKKRYLEQK